MADGLDLSEIVRRTAQANARLYKGWLDLSLEYFRGISEIFGGTSASGPIGSAPIEEMDAGGGILVLEGEEGATVAGAFLITNDLGRAITCDLVASTLIDSNGVTVAAKTAFQPQRLELAPGEQRVVQFAVTIDGRLTPGVAYNGEISVKGMDGFAVPFVVRRQHRIDEPSEQEVDTKGEPKDEPNPGSPTRPDTSVLDKAGIKNITKKPNVRPIAADKTAVRRKAKQKD